MYRVSNGRLGRTAAFSFRLHQLPDDVGIQIALHVRRQVASWKGSRVGEYRRAPRLRALMQPEGCGPSESAVCRFYTASKGRGPHAKAAKARPSLLFFVFALVDAF